MKRIKQFIFFSAGCGLLILIVTNIWIVKSTEDRVLSNDDLLDGRHRVALVLGTSHKVAGKANPFFEKRMDAAAELYHLKKIEHFLVSGDNSTKFYNEPHEMQKALIARGVPASAITLDYAGLRTLDSVVRCKEIFGQDKIVIITQSFHSYRALFISDFYKLEAVAITAEEPDLKIAFKVRIREYLARTKAVLDLYILRTSPKFMGEKEELKI